MEHKPFTFFESLSSNVGHHNLHMVTAVFVAALLILATVLLYPRFKKAKENVLPAHKFGIRAIFEILVEMLNDLCHEVIGHGYRKYVPLVGSIFFFIFFSNLIGMIPGFLPPTENWATGCAVAIIVFLAFNYFGFRENGVGYLKHFLAPLSVEGIKGAVAWFLATAGIVLFQVLFSSIELIGIIIRPITLTIRLNLNITTDHRVLDIMSNLAWFTKYLIPIPFMVLGLFVCFIQAFVFTMLTTVYISLSTAHDH